MNHGFRLENVIQERSYATIKKAGGIAISVEDLSEQL